ncbi:TDT family transporter [Psychromonas antarctica]|uniref:TDT family transporter n=1 Tax=Psychromonas antarctica TaxID=67573 RepID=UPI001EE82150|nr:TDT family transporter [Psychromonas antarctica]
MLKIINNYLSQLPSALAGLALGIASLGLCWENAVNLQGAGQIFGTILASCILVPLVFKFLVNPHLLKQDLQHYIGGSVTPTLAMATMVVANNIALYHFLLGQIISSLAIILHLCFLLLFIYYRSKSFKLEHILPSWFIPPIGLVIALIMHPGGLYPLLADLVFGGALLAYALLLPTVLYRLLYSKKLCEHEQPILIILATPASLLLVGYFASTTQANYLMVALLATLAVVMTLFAYLALIKLLRLPFTPAYSVFTFPLVVGATALFKTSHFLAIKGYLPLAAMTEQLAYMELVIATLMVIYVSIRYIHYLSVPKAFFNEIKKAR